MFKVLMISNLPTNLSQIRGGVESAVINLLTGLSKLSIKIQVVCLHTNLKYLVIKKFSENISIHYLPTGFIKNNLYDYLIYDKRETKNIINSFQPDIIHIQGTGPHLMLLKHRNINNIIVTQHGIMKEEKKHQLGLKNKIKFGFKSIIESIYFKKIKNIIFISNYNKNLLNNNQLKKILNSKNIPNPINSLFFSFQKDKRNVNRIIYIGSINKRKGLINLLKAIQILKNKNIHFHLDVIGGYTSNSYQNLINIYLSSNFIKPNIKFHGWQSQEYIGKMMTENNIFVLPSYQETLPISIAEAMAAGLVVVANNIGGISEMIINNKTGFLYKDNDFKELSYILEKLYNNRKLSQLVSSNAKFHAKQLYSPEIVAKSTYKFYQKVLKSIILNKNGKK